jgi:hypothetical protein
MRLFLLLFCYLPFLSAYQYEVAICAIFQDDARFLSEWIDYHKHIGVEHFYLYNNRSTDNYNEVLAPYVLNGDVTLYNWPYTYKNGDGWNRVQCSTYSDCLQKCKNVVHWLAIIDTDEFIIPVNTPTLPETLKFFEAVPAVGVNWQMYGTSLVNEVLPGERMTYSLLLRAPDDTPEHLIIKSIVQPALTVPHATNPHYFSYTSGFCVNTDGKKIDEAFAPYVATNVLRINHYWCRDEKFMREEKIPRRNKMYKDSAEYILNNNNRYNAVYDDIIMRKW